MRNLGLENRLVDFPNTHLVTYTYKVIKEGLKQVLFGLLLQQLQEIRWFISNLNNNILSGKPIKKNKIIVIFNKIFTILFLLSYY